MAATMIVQYSVSVLEKGLPVCVLISSFPTLSFNTCSYLTSCSYIVQ